MNNQQHLSLSAITAYLHESLTSNDQVQIREHLDSCQECAELLAIAQQLNDVAGRPQENLPPQDLLNRVTKAAVRKMRGSVSAVQKVLPQMADSKLSPSLAGMRGVMQNKHVIYADDSAMVNLDVESLPSTEGLYVMRGQVSITDIDEQDLAGIEVQLLNDKGVVRRCITDQIGQFRMSGIQNDRYRLHIEQLPHTQIVVENITF